MTNTVSVQEYNNLFDSYSKLLDIMNCHSPITLMNLISKPENVAVPEPTSDCGVFEDKEGDCYSSDESIESTQDEQSESESETKMKHQKKTMNLKNPQRIKIPINL